MDVQLGQERDSAESGGAGQDGEWNGAAPRAIDGRVLALVGVVGGLAASLNLPYGGPAMAAVAFVVLGAAGAGAHLLGERQLRRTVDGLVDRWIEAGGAVDGVTRSSPGLRTEWVVHTDAGPLVVGGLPLAPVTKLSIERDGIGDVVDVPDSDERLDRLAREWYAEAFAER